MNLLDWPWPPAERHVYFAWIDPDGNIGNSGQVNVDQGAGYTTLDIIYGNRAAVVYHSAWGDNPTYVTVSIDSDPPGQGFFDHYDPPDEIFPQNPSSPGRLYWPYIAVDGNDNIHIVMNENTPLRMQRMCYSNSTDGGSTWSSVQLVDTVMVLGSVIDASPVSDRVVIAYPKTQDTTSQWQNDIVYIASEDGLTWDFNNDRVNVTNYYNDNDSLLAYTDLDVIIDYDDYVHAVWTAQWVTEEGVYFRTYLFHYSEETGNITEILHHPDSLWWSIAGSWNRPICKMNLGVYDIVGGADGIFVTWTQFDTLDVSVQGYGNGELYMSYSIDGGSSWSEPENLTNSPTPNCQPGDCDSDNWSSLADVVDDSLYIIYMNDKAPAASQKLEGSPTEVPVMYLAYPNPLVTGIDEIANRPVSISLSQNYPNPFNAVTTISFSLKDSGPTLLEVFDITGSRAATLIDGIMSTGVHSVNWDATDVASGVYFYQVISAGNKLIKKAVLLK